MAEINIGDTVEVRTTGSQARWRGEVLGFAGDLAARVMCIDARAHNGMSEGLVRSVRLQGDPRQISVGDVVSYASAVGPWTGTVQAIYTSTALVLPSDPEAAAAGPLELPLADLQMIDDPEPDDYDLPGDERDRPDSTPDPVEIVAWVVRDHKVRDRNVTRSGAPDDTDRADARRLLTALVAGPWHLVTGQRQTGTVMHLAGGGEVPGDRLIEIHQEWKP